MLRRNMRDLCVFCLSTFYMLRLRTSQLIVLPLGLILIQSRLRCGIRELCYWDVCCLCSANKQVKAIEFDRITGPAAKYGSIQTYNMTNVSPPTPPYPTTKSREWTGWGKICWLLWRQRWTFYYTYILLLSSVIPIYIRMLLFILLVMCSVQNLSKIGVLVE